MDKKPWELDYSATDTDNAGVKPWQQYGAAPKKGLGFVAKSMQTAGDLGVSLLSGAVSVPDSLVGLADATSTFLGVNNNKGNAVRKTLANDDGAVGFNPAQAKRAIDNWHSDDYKDKQQQFAQAKGVLAKTGVALSNPSLIANTVAESLPAMGAGGVAGMGARGLAAKAGVNLSARAAGAIGEGTLMAGQQAANIQEQTGGLTQGQAGAALLTGALGGGISVMGARAAQKMGVGDIDTALVSGSAGKIAPQSVPLAAIKGAVSEGLLEELPQSVVEQLIGNIATGKPWYDNLDGAVVMGALSGGAMGGVFGAAQGKGWGKAGEMVDKHRQSQNQPSESNTHEQQGTAVDATQPLALPSPESLAMRDALDAGLAQLRARRMGENRAEYDARMEREAEKVAEFEQRFVDDWQSGNILKNTGKSEYDTWARAVASRAFAPPNVEQEAENGEQEVKLSEKMGLNPDAGAMQAAAALAVDSGASPVAPPLSPEELAEKEAREDWEDRQWYEQQLAYEQYEREQEQEAADWARDWAVAVQRGMADGYSASQASQMYDDARSQAAPPQEVQTVPTPAPQSKQQAAAEPQSEAAPSVRRQPMAQALPKAQVDTEPTAAASSAQSPAGVDNAAPVAVKSEVAKEKAVPVEAVRQTQPEVSAAPEPLATQAESSAMPKEAVDAPEAAETNAAPTEAEMVVEPAKPTAKKAAKSKGRDAQRQLVSDWGMRVDGWAVNAEYQGAKETDNGVVGGVKDAFLNDAKAYLTAVQHELADMGFVPQLDKKGKPHKVAVNKGGTGVSGDAYLMMQRDDGTPVYVTVGTRGGSRPVVMFRVGDSSNHHPDNQMSAGSLAEMVEQYTRPAPQTPVAESKKPETVKETTDNGKQQSEARAGAVHSGTGNQSERVSELAENGTGTLESVSAENVSSVSTGGDFEVSAGNRGGDDISGSVRAGVERYEAARSVGNGTGEVSAAAARTTDVAEPSAAEPAPVKKVGEFKDRADVEAVLADLGVRATVKNWDASKGRRIYINLHSARESGYKGDKSYSLYYDVENQKLVSTKGKGVTTDVFMGEVKKIEEYFKELANVPQAETPQGAVAAVDAAGVENQAEAQSVETPAAIVEQVEPVQTDTLQEQDGAPAVAAPADFVITDADEIGQGGLKTKFKQNIEAIKTLRVIQAENDRAATPAEQKVLAKWVGWGGLAAAFRREDGSVAKGWDKEAAQLEALLSDDELRSARESTIAAHYTSPEVVKAMWAAVRQMGFQGGRVLEPAVGSGNFIGLMPQDFRQSAAVHGTELDSVTGALAQKLYPAAAVKVMGFQDYTIPDGYFKLAIGNPPFGAVKVSDKHRRHLSGLSLHNYFFAKSVDALEDNGVLAMVVTSRFMDAGVNSARARNYIAERTELLAAVRLPNNAFLKNANTQVTTDIVFLRKLPEAERGKGVGAAWNAVKPYTDKNGNGLPLNVYFHEHPEMMLGEFGAFGSMYGPNEAALVARDGQDTAALLEKALQVLPQNVFAEPQQDDVALATAAVADIGDVKVGSVFVRDGKLWRRTPDVLGESQAEAVELPNDKARERVMGLIGIRDALARVRRLQLTGNVPDAVLDKARESLNGLYDAFVKSNGFINSVANFNLFRDDPSWAQLASLEEKYDRGVSAAVSKTTGEKARKPSAQKAAIFSRRTQYPFKAVDKVASAKDGLVESLSSVGRLDMERIVRLYGKSEADVVAELGDLVYQDPQQGWQTAEAYLSGNVKEKLAQAQLAAKENSAFARNVQALQKVQPEDIEAVDIGSSARLGAHWIPAAYLGDFLKQVMGVHSLNDVAVFNPLSNEWKLPDFEPSQNAKTAFSTERKSIREVVAAAVNSRQLNVYDETDDKKRVLNQEASDDANSKVEAVKQAWADWVWQDDERRETLSRLYNDTFNTDVPRHYDGSHLTLAGKVDDAVIALRPTQKDAVWRITQNRTTLLDHVVGAGKTFTMVAAAMELRRMGLASKPMIVVPNHLVGQWGQEFLQLYPNADILVAGKKDFEAANRKRLVARIANGDWDAVIVAHSSFGKIAVGADFEAQFIQQQIDEIERALETMRASEGRRALSVKDLEKRRLNLQEKYKKLVAAEHKDDDNLSWGELGVDALFVDEAHEFKNLAFSSTMRNVAGLGNQAGSQRAMDLYMKIQQLKQNPSSRVVFATGTPISNSMAEMYTMQRYLGEERLRRQGINHFDAWAKTFGEVVTDWELSASGKYKLKARFAKFVGLPELMQGYLAFADVINRDDINEALKAQGKTLPVPKIKGGAPENVVVPRSDFQAEYIGVPVTDEQGNETYPEKSLVYRAEHLPKGVQEKGADNMLKIVGEARKLALDPRIIDPSAPDFADSKVNTAARRIVDIYRRWEGQRGTQLVFSDLSTPKAAAVKEKAVLEDLARRADNGDEAAAEQLGKYSPDELDALLNGSSFSVYDDLKAKLMDAGIPEAEIAFIHDANTEQQKADLFGKVRSGRVRVLIGSTSKMGAGTNVQNRLVALHHLDAPWRPSDLEQREGRIIRQGNELYAENPDGFEVEILRYATEQTMDAMQWQIIENKARFIEQVRKGDVSSRVIEDVGGEAANAAQMKAASSGNPLILEEMSLRKQVNDLEAQKLRHERNLYRVRSGIRRTQAEMENDQRRIGELEKLLKAKTPAKLDITIGKKRFTHDMEQARTEAGKALLSQVRTVAGSSAVQGKTVGQYGDFSLRLVPDALVLDTVYLHLDYADTDLVLEMKRDDAAGGVLTRIRNLIENTRHELEKHQHRLEQNRASLPKMQKQLSEWDGAERLAQVREEHARVLALLKPKSGGQAQAAKPNTDNQKENESDKPSFDVADAAPVNNPTVAAYRAAIRRAVGKENMRHVRIISRKRAKEILPVKHHAYIERLRGWHSKGKVVLVADNIASARVAQFTAWHELGHRGVAVSGWSDWAKALNQAYLGNPLFRQIADTILAWRADTHDKAGRDKLAAAEEALVELYAAKRTGDFSLLESRYGVKVSERFRGWQSRLMQVLARLREIAGRLFGFGDSFSDGDLLRLMKRLDKAEGLDMAKAVPALDLAVSDSFDDVAFDLEIDENGFLNNPDKVSQAVNQAIRRHVRTGGVRRALGDKWTDGLKVSLQFLGRRQLTEIYRHLLPQLDHYGELADKYSADGNRAMIRSDKLVSGWAKLKDKDALADLMHDATLAQVDADSAVKPELPADFKAWLPLRQRFNRLSPEAQAVYRQARDDYRSHFEGVQAAMEARLQRLGANAGAVERVRKRFSEGMKGVYFPLARFGNYVVAAKNANGKVISIGRAETMKEARTLRESYLRDFPAKDGFSVGQVQLAKEYAQSRDAVGTGFLKNALDALSELNLSNEQFAGIEDTLHQLYLQSLPDLSWAKHGIHRKGTKGFSNDAMRAYARNMVHGAEYLAKLRYGDLMTAALDDMQDFSDRKRDDKDFNQPVAQRVIDEMRKRHESLLRSDVNPVAAGMTGLGFVWYLGASPAAALVNLSQTPLVAFPMMAAKWGWLKAGQALLSASAQTGIGGGGADLNNVRSHLNEDEQAAFDRAEADGTIDIGQVHDLIRMSSGAGGKGGKALHQTMKVAGWMFHQAERFNRQSTFVAAYRLARQAGADAEKAFEQAKDMVFRSQFDYSAENRPRVMQGNWQRVLFLFKQYSQNMIYTLARNAQLSFKGNREAQKTLAWLLAGHAMAAGVLGLPLVGELLAIASLLGGDDDEPWDAETALRLWLSETFGNTAGEVVAKGASRLTPWDVSGRVGLNNLIFPDVQDGLQGRRWAESFAAGMSGPVVGLGISWADGANKIADGDWQRGLESMLPVALRNALKSWRLASEGHIDKSGVVVKDEIGWGGVLGQSVGFSPSELRLAMEGKAAVMKADRELNSRRSELQTKFARASMDSDTEKMAQTRKEIAAFNRKHPNRAITVSHLLQSVRNRRRRITQAQDGVYLPRNHRDALGAGSFAHDD